MLQRASSIDHDEHPIVGHNSYKNAQPISVRKRAHSTARSTRPPPANTRSCRALARQKETETHSVRVMPSRMAENVISWINWNGNYQASKTEKRKRKKWKEENENIHMEVVIWSGADRVDSEKLKKDNDWRSGYYKLYKKIWEKSWFVRYIHE